MKPSAPVRSAVCQAARLRLGNENPKLSLLEVLAVVGDLARDSCARLADKGALPLTLDDGVDGERDENAGGDGRDLEGEPARRVPERLSCSHSGQAPTVSPGHCQAV